ncbi:Lcl C-terminal domain-containing protein [Microbulbifer celer]|uniref:DUF1566 domain-containing protein n=1 Tax=Microbulbifer celer TaxID=435905 RepID=A0ABW3U987_9GAMM|nr:DUF1566 domain-containing protein [Microbulbifer celer]UFN58546.1 DUF1566 domain-containing protein [Microbulbifer celer]
MQNLNIKMPGKTISIDINGGDLSINMDSGVASNQSTAELEWSHTLLEGEVVTYEAAEDAISEMGDGWRMPTVDELATLVDRNRHDPAIDTDKYPDTKSRAYWTSTPCAWNDAAVWCVSFRLGTVHHDRRYDSACVRAVRSGQ